MDKPARPRTAPAAALTCALLASLAVLGYVLQDASSQEKKLRAQLAQARLGRIGDGALRVPPASIAPGTTPEDAPRPLAATDAELRLQTGNEPIVNGDDEVLTSAELSRPRRLPRLSSDCDGSGVVDSLDLVCFARAHASRLPYADCDKNGEFDELDFLAFQSLMLSEQAR